MQINGRERDAKLPGPDQDRRKRGRKVSLILLFFLAAAFLLDISTVEKLPRLCIWYRLTGIDCPFCGLVRSLFLSADGSFALAMKYHPFGPVVFGAVIFFLAGSLYAWFTGKAFSLLAWLDKNSRKAAIILVILWLAWWLAHLPIAKSDGLK